jgi:hypothetical protein
VSGTDPCRERRVRRSLGEAGNLFDEYVYYLFDFRLANFVLVDEWYRPQESDPFEVFTII